MNKCPACGYDLKKSHDVRDIGKFLKLRNKKTRQYLNKIAGIISRNVPSETRLNYYQFLYGIQEIEDNIIQWAIEEYYNGKHYIKGKGFPYLRSIIKNRDKNLERIAENERKMLGSPPPIIGENK